MTVGCGYEVVTQLLTSQMIDPKDFHFFRGVQERDWGEAPAIFSLAFILRYQKLFNELIKAISLFLMF